MVSGKIIMVREMFYFRKCLKVHRSVKNLMLNSHLFSFIFVYILWSLETEQHEEQEQCTNQSSKEP